MSAAIPTSAIAMVASRNGAPTIAPDRDIITSLRTADDRDHRDQRLGHRGADGGEDAPDRALAEPEPVARPLDRVGEEESAAGNDREGDE